MSVVESRIAISTWIIKITGDIPGEALVITFFMQDDFSANLEQIKSIKIKSNKVGKLSHAPLKI